MIKDNSTFIYDFIDLQEIGRRLGLIVAKFKNGREGAQTVANISSFTLDRYLAGKTRRIDLICMAAICRAQGINLNWLLYGDDFSMYLDNV